MLGGLHHRIPGGKACPLHLIDLGHQNHRVADDDADQRQDPQDRHKAHRCSRRHQRQHHADQAQRRDAGHQEQLLHAVQLDHQEGGHQEQHQRHHFGNRPLGLATLLHRTAGGDLVAHRQTGGEFVDVRFESGHQVGGLYIADDRRLDGDGRPAVATPYQRLLQFVTHGGKGQQRNRGAARRDDLQVLQGFRRTPFGVHRTTDHVDQVDIIVNLGHGRTADNAVHQVRHVLGRQAELARLVLGDVDAQYLAGLVPVENDLADVRALVQFAGQVDGVLAHLVDVLAADPILHRPPDWRPHFQRLHVTADADEVFAQALTQAIAEGFAGFEVFADDHQLRVIGVLQLLVEGQVETNRALADVGAPAHDVRVALERRFELVHRFAGFVDGGVLRQVQVHQDFRAIRGREELVLHEPHAEHRQPEQQHGDANRPPAIAHAPQQASIECPPDTPRFGRMRLHVGAENVHADHRGEQHGDDPRHQHGHGNHRKQGEGVFAGGTGVQADRHETGDGHQRAGEHRESRGGVGEGGGLLLGVAQLQARDHHLDGDHRVIHQQAQGNDQRTQGNPLHGDAAVFHEHEDHRQHQRDRARHHQPGAHAQADEADHQHDHHRFEQRTGETADGFFHHHRLVGHVVHADAHGQVGGQLIDALMQRLAEHLDVAALLHGDGQADGGLAVVAKLRRRRVDVAAADIGDVGQAIEAVVETQVDVGQILFGNELPGGAHGNPLGTGLDHPGRGHGVLGLQALHHLLLVDAQRRQFACREIQVEDFVLLADHLDFAQPRYIVDLGAGLLDVIAQLTHRQPVGGKGIDRTEHITELIVERGALNPLRERAANIVDLLAHLVPDFRDVLGAGGVAQVHVDRGLTGTGVAFHVVERVEFFEFFLDAVGDLLEGFFLGRAGPAGLDHHGFDGERGVFLAAQVHVGKHAHQQRDEHQVPDKRLMLEGPFR